MPDQGDFPRVSEGPPPSRHHGKWGDTGRAKSGWEKREDWITLTNLWQALAA